MSETTNFVSTILDKDDLFINWETLENDKKQMKSIVIKLDDKKSIMVPGKLASHYRVSTQEGRTFEQAPGKADFLMIKCPETFTFNVSQKVLNENGEELINENGKREYSNEAITALGLVEVLKPLSVKALAKAKKLQKNIISKSTKQNEILEETNLEVEDELSLD